MNKNTEKKPFGFSLTNILLICILVVVVAVAVAVFRNGAGITEKSADTGESSTVSIASEEDHQNDTGEGDAKEDDETADDAEDEASQEELKNGSDDGSKEQDNAKSVIWDNSEEKEDSKESAKDNTENTDKTEEKGISLKEFTKHNASLPFSKDEDDDDIIVAFDTDDTLLVPSSEDEIEGAVSAINHLEGEGYDWCIVSANADDDKPQRIKEWILDELESTDHYLGFYIVNPGRDRYNWCNENNVDVLVDDNKDTAKLADDYLFHTLLVDGSGVEETTYLHPMKGSSPYNGFRRYIRSIKLLINLK